MIAGESMRGHRRTLNPLRDQLREVIYEPKSLMPTDYDKRLAPDEFEDLLTFLSRLGTLAPGK
jgi:hypothetical protein